MFFDFSFMSLHGTIARLGTMNKNRRPGTSSSWSSSTHRCRKGNECFFNHSIWNKKNWNYGGKIKNIPDSN